MKRIAGSRGIAVTGAAGFIGRAVAANLIEQGHDVVGIDDLSTQPLVSPPSDLLVLDVHDLRSHHLNGIDAVIHLAGYREVAASFHSPQRYRTNVTAAAHLGSLVRRSRVRRLVFGSSCEVYGAVRSQPINEETRVAPRSPYAVSKACAEYLFELDAHDGRFELTIARLFNVVGPGHRADTVVAAFCKAAATGAAIVIEGSGEQRRDMSPVSWTAGVLCELAVARSAPRRINVGSGRAHSVNDIAAIVKAREPSVTVLRGPARPNEIPEFVASTEHLRELGIEPSTMGIDELIDEALTWWRETFDA